MNSPTNAKRISTVSMAISKLKLRFRILHFPLSELNEINLYTHICGRLCNICECLHIYVCVYII